MSKSSRVVLTWAILAAGVLLSNPLVRAANNPNGFIQTTGWNMLLGLQQGSSANGGGPANMQGNWVAPHNLGLEDPKALTEWADIAFGAPKSTGWAFGAIAPNPTWVDYPTLVALGAAAVPPVAMPAPGNIVDFDALLNAARQIPEPDLVAGPTTDNMLSIATTYVQNNNPGPITVGVGSSSDDGCQIYVNDVRILTRSDARGVLGINTQINVITNLVDFEEVSNAVLPPGISKITAMVWEGGGGHGLRLGLVHKGKLLNDGNAAAAGIEFLGTGSGNGLIVGQAQGADPIARNFCPFGWVLTKGWNLLGPLDNPYSGDANARTMMGNWTAPYDIRNEDPKSGDEWAIDFSRATATGYAAREFVTALGITEGNPIWFNYNDLRDTLETVAGGLGTGLPGSGEGIDPFGRGLVDLEDIYRYLSAKLRSVGIPTIDGRDCLNPADYNAGCDPDLLVSLATTYVKNTTGADLPVRIATAADDGHIVYVNCQLVTLQSRGGGSSRTPQELRTAVLPPGISKIAVLVYEGGGGHNFRLGIRPQDSIYNYADGDAAIQFLGHGTGDPSIVGVKQFCMERTFDSVTESKDSVKVTIKGNGNGNPSDPITVIENFQAYAPENVSITGVSSGGTVDVAEEDNVYTNLSSSGGDIWADCDRFQFDYVSSAGDFDIAVQMLQRSHSTGFSRFGKFGLMARYDLTPSAPFGMAQDIGPDSLDNTRGATRKLVSGTDGCDNMVEVGGFTGITHHAALLRIKRTGNILRFYRSNNPALADGTLDANNDVNWARFASDADGDFGAATPPATMYVGFANSEHNSNGVQVQRVVYRLLPSSWKDGNSANKIANWENSTFLGVDGGGKSGTTFGTATVGKRILWVTTVGAVNAGLSYSVSSSDNLTRYLQFLPARRIESAYLGVVGPPFTSAPDYFPSPPYPAGTVGVFPYLVSGSTSGMPINPKLYGPVNDTGHLNLPLTPGTGPVGDFSDARDVGWPLDPPTQGSTTFDGTVYTVKGGGSDVWDNSDHMHYAFKEVTGDFVATARIANAINPPNARWGRMGIMARYTLDPGSKYSMACVPFRGEDINNNDSRRHQSRRTHFGLGATADATGNVTRDQQVVPMASVNQQATGWVRLTRIGNYFYSQFADDVEGEPGPWVVAGGDQHHPTAPDTLLLGLVSSAHGTGGANLLTVEYDNWSVEPLVQAEDVCQELDEIMVDDFEAGVLDPNIYLTVQNTAFIPSVQNGRLRLAGDTIPSQANAVWINTNGLSIADTGFKAEYDAYYGKASGADPADGFTFAVVQGEFNLATGLVGDGGGGMGYNRGGPDGHNLIPAQRPKGFAVELDVWNGGHLENDPPGQASNGNGAGEAGGGGNQDNRYHMGIDFNFETQSAVNNVEYGAMLPSLFDNPASVAYHNTDGIHVEVFYNPADSTGTSASLIEVYVTGNDGSYPRTKVLAARGPRLEGEVFMGFTAGTGGANANYEVDNFSLSERCCEVKDAASIAQQATVNLATQDVVTLDGSASSGADGGFSYSWEVVSGPAQLLSATGVKPDLKLTGGGDVTVKLTVKDGFCADTASAQMTFTVLCDDPPEIAKITGAPAGTTAVNAPVVLDAAGSSAGTGDSKAFTYLWTISSGPGAIDGAADKPTVTVKGTSPGTVTAKLTVDDGKCGNFATATASFCVDDPDDAVINAPAGPYGVGSTVVLDSAPGSSAGGRAWSIVSGPGEIVGAANGNTVSVKGTGAGDVVVKLGVDDGICTNPTSTQKTLSFSVLANWIRGDANGDKVIDISDPVWSLSFQFSGGPASACPGSLDSNADGSVDISDPVADLNRLFVGAELPPRWQQCEQFDGCTTNCP